MAARRLLDRARRSRSSSLAEYAMQGASARRSREGGRDGGRRGHAAAAADLEPAEADGADRRQAVHGAHPRAAPRARLRGRRRHGRVPAAGDPLLLRRRHEPRPEHPVLGRGEPARHGRLGAARLGRARRDVPRHLRRRALRHRPARRSSTFHKEKGAAVTIGLKSVENPLEFGIVVTDEDGKVERFLEKPSWGQVFSDTINTGIYVLEPEVLQARPDRPAVRLLEGALPAAARDGPADLRLRLRRLLAGHREPRPVPAGELRRARRARPAQRSRA